MRLIPRVAWRLKSRMIVLAILVAGCNRSVAPADRVAEMNGEPIPYTDFEDFLVRNSVDGAGVLGSDVLSSLLDQFLDERLLCRLAEDRLGLLQITDGRAAVAALIPQEPVSPDRRAVTAYYRENRARFDLPERILMRQLLFTDRETAERTRSLWAAGALYQKVIDEIAAHPTAHVGEEGEFARASLPPAFADVLFDLDDGGVSEVLAADYGFHVFQVVRHLPAGLAPLSEVAAEIGAELASRQRQESLERLVEEARERYNVRVFERNVPFNYEGEFDSNLDNESR